MKQIQNEDGVIFKTITLNNKPLEKCDVVYRGEHDNARLYVDIEKEKSHFFAKAVRFVSGSYFDGDQWEDSELVVEVLFEIVALHDGVRHAFFGPENEGYIYYP